MYGQESENYGIIFQKICISIYLFCLTFFFGYLPFKLDKIGKNYKLIGVANAFSGGIFLCISLLHLLPESAESFKDFFLSQNPGSKHSFPFSYLLAFVGYITILLIEKIIFDSSNFSDAENSPNHKHDHHHNHNDNDNNEYDNYNYIHTDSRHQILPSLKKDNESESSYELNEQNHDISHTDTASRENSFAGKRKTLNNVHTYNKRSSAYTNLHTNLYNPNLLHSNKNNKMLNVTKHLNLNLESLEGIEEEIKDSAYKKKLRSCADIPDINPHIHMPPINSPMKRNRNQNFRLNKCYNDDLKSENMTEYVDKMISQEEERKEQKFKKLFSQKGKFASFAKRKFKSFRVSREVNEERSPDFDIAKKVYNEVFEETRPSLNEKELLLTKEETKLFNKNNITSFLLLFALSVHAFFEGIALGLLEEEREIAYMIIAISFHKWVEAISIGINLHKSYIEKEVLLVLITLFALTTPIGVILGIVLKGISKIFEAIFLSISAGTFLYISASEVVVEEFAVSQYKVQKFIGFVLGAILISIFTIFEHSQ